MGLIAGWGEILGRLSRETVDASPFPFAKEYVKAWCKVVQKYPRLVGIPVYGRAFVSGACPALGVPSPELPPPLFDGRGQCCDAPYRVRALVIRTFNGKPHSDLNVDMLQVPGAIVSMGVEEDINNGNSFLYYRVRSVTCDGTPVVRQTPIGGVGFTGVEDERARQIDIQNGLIDNCYDPFSEYPPDPPIDPRDFTPDVEIPRHDDEGNPLPPLIIPIQINVNTNSELNVDIDIGGDKYDIDFEGFKKRDTPPVLQPKTKPAPGDSDAIEKDPKDTEDGLPIEEEIEDGEELLWVLVDVTTQPHKGKTITYKNPDDVTYFAGYFSWLVAGNELYRMPEIPVRKRYNAFQAPEGAKGYRLIPINGAKLSSRAYVQEI